MGSQNQTMSHIRRAKEVIAIEAEALQRVEEALDASFDDAVQLILSSLEAGGKVVVAGIGKSHHIAQKIAATCTSTGTPSATLHPSEAMHGDIGILSKGDVLLGLSFSGGSEEMLQLVPLARRIGLKIVSITQRKNTPIAEASDVIITVPVEREACPFNMAPTASTTATLAVGDALAIVLLEARGFGKDDYAKLHPGGAIGRTLLLRVADIMRSADRLAKVAGGSQVREAILAMTKARSGAVAIVDEQDRLLGIVTDGDLRRLIAADTNLAECLVDDVMTRDPITLRANQLAIDALNLYEQHNVDDLVVVDADGKVVGLIDIQDLPKLKIL